MTTRLGVDELIVFYAKYIERWAGHRKAPQAFIVHLLVDGPFALPTDVGAAEVPYLEAFQDVRTAVREAGVEGALEPVLRSRLAKVLIELVTAECERRHALECTLPTGELVAPGEEWHVEI